MTHYCKPNNQLDILITKRLPPMQCFTLETITFPHSQNKQENCNWCKKLLLIARLYCTLWWHTYHVNSKTTNLNPAALHRP